jgi:hypothetical protein
MFQKAKTTHLLFYFIFQQNYDVSNIKRLAFCFILFYLKKKRARFGRESGLQTP